MTDIQRGLNLEALQKMFRDLSWKRQKQSAILEYDKSANVFQGDIDDNLAGNGDFRMNGLVYLCENCGYLSASTATECDACQANEWLDLRDISVSKSLRYKQWFSRDAIPLSTKLLTGAIHLCLFVAITVGITYSFPVGYGWSNITHEYPLAGWYWVIAPILLLTSYYVSTRHLHNWFHRFSKALPKRWHLPTEHRMAGSSQEAEQNVTGRLKADNTLIAPFSESKCIGYRISVLSCDRNETRPPEWLLEESRNSPCTLAGHTIGQDSLTFMLTGNQLNIDSDDMQKQFRQYLNHHGLFPENGKFWIFETVLTSDDNVTATVYPDRHFATVTQIEKSNQ